MLAPRERLLYTAALAPPLGMRFDQAIATSFSLDPATVLQVPVTLAFSHHAGKVPNVLATLDAIRRFAGRITVYVQKGGMKAPRDGKANPVYSLLDRMIVEVPADGGVFHPKVWAMRFVATGDGHGVLWRLVVLTRNITADDSWDLSLQLEGGAGDEDGEDNAPLAQFFEYLAKNASEHGTQAQAEQARLFAKELRRVRWELPQGFDQVAFHYPVKKFFQTGLNADRLAVISPFCKDETLELLAGHAGKEGNILLSTPEALAALKPDTLELFTVCYHFADDVHSDGTDDAETDAPPRATGLHAKAYIFEKGQRTRLVLGSANATNAARNGNNVEILVELVGRRRHVGGIDAIFGNGENGTPQGSLRSLLCEFVADGVPTLPDEAAAEQEQLEDAAMHFAAEAKLELICSARHEGRNWNMKLAGTLPPLQNIARLRAWPISLGPAWAADLACTQEPISHTFADIPLAAITGLVAFELAAESGLKKSLVLNLPVQGLPEGRDQAVTQDIVGNEGDFLRYFHMLLESMDSGLAGIGWFSPAGGGSQGGGAQAQPDFALLENWIRAFARDRKLLQETGSLIRDLQENTRQKVLPDAFLQLWKVFEQAMAARDGQK